MDQNNNNGFNNQNNNDYTNQYNQYNQPQQYEQPHEQQQYTQPQQQQYQPYGQPQQYNEPYFNQKYPAYQEVEDKSAKNFAIASLVLGIVSFFCCGLICSILGLIFGILSRKRMPQNNGMATAGIVLSIIALVLGAIGFILIFALDGYYYYY